MGVFDIVLSLLSWADGLAAVILPSVIRLVLWGVIASVSSMGIYVLLSYQEKLSRIKADAAKARADLLKYDDDFDGIWRPIQKMLMLSCKQVGYSLIPSIVGALPVILLIIWVGTTFNYRSLDPGTLTEITIYPPQSNVRWYKSGTEILANNTCKISWPHFKEPLKLIDSDNQIIATFPLARSSPVLSKHKWWNTLIGDPNGFIPKDSPIEKIEVKLPRYRYLTFGPEWMHSAEIVFILSVLVCSLSIKFVFHIH